MLLGPMHPTLLPYTPDRDVYRAADDAHSVAPDELPAACRHLAKA